jgi:hypothetical protein
VSEAESAGVVVPVLWVGGDDLDVISINQFIVQVEKGEIYLTVGTMTPPVILSDQPDEIRRQAESIEYVPVRTVAKYSLTRRGLEELAQVLQRGIDMDNKQKGGSEG